MKGALTGQIAPNLQYIGYGPNRTGQMIVASLFADRANSLICAIVFPSSKRLAMDNSAIYEFMTQYRYGVVSSLSTNGSPQSALVGIAVGSELEIIFDTLNYSRKYKNLIERPACAFVVGWPGEKTIQYEGLAVEPKGAELKRYQEIYFAVWPEGLEHRSWPGIAYFVVRPMWIRYSDYDRKPPLIDEILFPVNS